MQYSRMDAREPLSEHAAGVPNRRAVRAAHAQQARLHARLRSSVLRCGWRWTGRRGSRAPGECVPRGGWLRRTVRGTGQSQVAREPRGLRQGGGRREMGRLLVSGVSWGPSESSGGVPQTSVPGRGNVW